MTTGTITVNHTIGDGWAVAMNVTGINPADPMDNFHLMMPGYGNGTTSVNMFTPAFLQKLQPFSSIRFMNWSQTNDSTLTNWSNRVPPGAFFTDDHGRRPLRGHDRAGQRIAEGHVDQRPGAGHARASSRAWRSSSTRISTPT